LLLLLLLLLPSHPHLTANMPAAHPLLQADTHQAQSLKTQDAIKHAALQQLLLLLLLPFLITSQRTGLLPTRSFRASRLTTPHA
jgi:hypothetical protein